MSGKAKITGYDELAAADLATGDMIEIVDVSESAAAAKNKKFALKPYVEDVVETLSGSVTWYEENNISANKTIKVLATLQVIEKIEMRPQGSINGIGFTVDGAAVASAISSASGNNIYFIYPTYSFKQSTNNLTKDFNVAASIWSGNRVNVRYLVRTLTA